MPRLGLLAIGVATLLTFATAGLAQGQPPKGISRASSVEGITEYRLDNGLRALLFPDPSKPTIVVNMTYLVGSRHENYGETGMAHLIEHLASSGSPRHPDAMKEQNDRGATANASTSFDRTNYYELFPASDENLEWALDLEADRMTSAFVRKETLASQMTVVRNEYESGENSPQSVLFKRVLAAAFDWHNYANLPIGARSDIENVPIERLRDFYARYYRPDNAVLVVAGRFDETKALNLLTKWFSTVKTPASPVPQTYTVEPSQDGERSVVLRRVGDLQQVGMLYKIPAGAHPDTALLSIAARVLASPPSGRLYKTLVETKKAAAVFGEPSLLREPGYMTFGAAVRKDASLEEARSIMAGILDGLAAQPFTKEEVERARAEILKSIDLSLNRSDQVGLALTDWAAAGDWRLLFINRDRIRKATPDDVQRATVAYLKPSNRTVGLLIPEDKPDRAEIPATPDIASLVNGYKGDELVSQGEAFDSSPENIERRTIRASLPDGLKVVMLSKKNRGATVTATIRLDFGAPASLKGRTTAASFTAQMLMRGTTKRTRQQIQDELNLIKAQMSVGGGATGVSVNIQTVAASLPAALRLATEVLREPAFPAAEFDQLRNSSLAGTENARQQPEALAQIALVRHMNPYPEDDVRYIRNVEEQIADTKKTNLDDAKKFYQDFYGASNAQIVVVGEFDPTEIQKLATELLANWKSPAAYARISRDYRKIAPASQTIETPDKANAVYWAGMPLNVGDTHPDYAGLMLGNYMFGGHSTSRLFLRVRGKDGLSYSVQSMLMADVKDPRADWIMMAIANPVNMAKVEAAFHDETDKTVKEGFTAEELAVAKKAWLQSRSVQRSQDAGLAARLLSYDREGRTLAFDAELEKKVSALTAEDVNAAWRKHVDPSQLSIVIAGDFKKSAPAPEQ